ncbi:MAG: toxin glutamine deamidase domain-containing protein, partial [Actinoplanes sp.]
MTVLPSPIPHPLDYSPFDVPGWAYEALEWVVGFDWPAGNEVTTWDVADRWYALAASLAEPRDEAFAAASQVLAGYGEAGVTADGFRIAWQQLAGDENAPLNALLQIAHDVGELVEGCGSDLEAAKLEAWIEIGLFLIELIGMTVAVALTLGAATPAAGGLIMATRLAVQQIFKRLIAQLGKKALKQSAQRAVRDITSRQGLKRLGQRALREGFDEAGEEAATNAGIQAYQQTGGRKNGMDLSDLGMSAAGGFAGGVASRGADIGSHGHGGGPLRGAGGEVLAEFGAAAVYGDLPSAEGVAKSAGSGAAGSAIHGLKTTTVDVSALSGTPGLSGTSEDVGGSFAASSFAAPAAGDSGGSTAAFSANFPDSSVASQSVPPSASGPDALFAPPPVSSLDAPSAPPPDASFAAPPFSSPDASFAPPPASSPDASFAPPPATNGPEVSLFAPAPDGPAVPSSYGGPDASLSTASSTALSLDTTTSSIGPDPTFVSVTDPTAGTPTATSPVLAATATSTEVPGSTTFPTGQPLPPPDPGTATRHITQSELDRIANALAPRPVRQVPPPDLSVLAPGPPRRPTVVSAPLPSNLDRAPRHSFPADKGPIRDEAGYFGYADHARQTHELNRREDYAEYLGGIAEDTRAKILDLGRQADAAFRVGSTLRGAHHRRQAADLSEVVAEIETEIDLVRSGELAPATIEVAPRDWARINSDVGTLAPGGIRTGDSSALTGFNGHPPVDRTRRYNTYGGLRAPLAVHQLDLENAVPRDGNGRAARLPDPRTGNWFDLANDGGPEADSTRGLNCVDGILALYDTYMHARPRVSAPRTFDSYANGNPDRPLGGEWNGVQRIEQTIGSTFQNLCPYVGAASPAQAKPAIDAALQNLTNHLHNNGHGSYAFIVTDLEGGGCHSWAAVNQNGTILFLDPQVRKVSAGIPLYRHHGVPTRSNIVSMDALVMTGEGRPAPLPFHGPGQQRSPTGTTGDRLTELIADTETTEAAAERAAYESLDDSERKLIQSAHRRSLEAADRILVTLHDVTASMPPSPDGSQARLVGTEHRAKEPHSIARTFVDATSFEDQDLEGLLSSMKDLVRFSVEVPEAAYGRTVAALLRSLAGRGHTAQRLLSFWGAGGRHNGLNV